MTNQTKTAVTTETKMTSYTQNRQDKIARRRAAAIKGWQTRRRKANS